MMKQTRLLVIAGIIGMVSGVLVLHQTNKDSKQYSDIMLNNIEALADGPNGDEKPIPANCIADGKVECKDGAGYAKIVIYGLEEDFLY